MGRRSMMPSTTIRPSGTAKGKLTSKHHTTLCSSPCLYSRINSETPYILEDGRFVGPFAVQLHTPGVGQHFLGMAQALRQLPGLSHINREIATLVVGSRFEAAYEVVAHKAIAKKVGLSEEEVNTLEKGQKPESLQEDGKAVFDVAHELAYGSGPLSPVVWDNSVRLVGKEATIAVVQYVGFYSYVSVVLRGFDVQVPKSNKVA